MRIPAIGQGAPFCVADLSEQAGSGQRGGRTRPPSMCCSSLGLLGAAIGRRAPNGRYACARARFLRLASPQRLKMIRGAGGALSPPPHPFRRPPPPSTPSAATSTASPARADADANADAARCTATTVRHPARRTIASVGAGLYHCSPSPPPASSTAGAPTRAARAPARPTRAARRSTARGAASRRTFSAPTLVSGLRTPQPEPVARDGRSNHCPLTSTHRLYCWGRPTHGQLLASRAASGAVAGGGRRRAACTTPDPRPLRALEHAASPPSRRARASLAPTPAGTVHAGGHASGRLGPPGWLSSSVDAPLPLPARAFGGRPVRTIAAGWRHALAVTASGALYCGRRRPRPARRRRHRRPAGATAVESLAKEVVLHVVAGGAHSLAATREGLVYAWGERPSASGCGDGAAAAAPARGRRRAPRRAADHLLCMPHGFSARRPPSPPATTRTASSAARRPPTTTAPTGGGAHARPLPAGARVRRVACGAYHTAPGGGARRTRAPAAGAADASC